MNEAEHMDLNKALMKINLCHEQRNRLHYYPMRKLIDLEDKTFDRLSLMAVRSKSKLKNYIEHVLNNHADNGIILFGAGPSSKRK